MFQVAMRILVVSPTKTHPYNLRASESIRFQRFPWETLSAD
jgi:hypothetical protein